MGISDDWKLSIDDKIISHVHGDAAYMPSELFAWINSVLAEDRGLDTIESPVVEIGGAASGTIGFALKNGWTIERDSLRFLKNQVCEFQIRDDQGRALWP